MSSSDSAICIVSGGLDSLCTASYIANEKKYQIYMITYEYGQRATRELELAKKFANILNVKEHVIVDIKFLKKLYGETNVLTNDAANIPQYFDYSIIVPIRNMIFITIATAWAMSKGSNLIVYGSHTGDFKYPDCRPQFINKLAEVLNLADEDEIEKGIRKKVKVWSPVVEELSKSDLIRYGYKTLGDHIYESWSCYSNGEKNNNQVILQCGICESCINRKEAFRVAGVEDKTSYVKV